MALLSVIHSNLFKNNIIYHSESQQQSVISSATRIQLALIAIKNGIIDKMNKISICIMKNNNNRDIVLNTLLNYMDSHGIEYCKQYDKLNLEESIIFQNHVKQYTLLWANYCEKVVLDFQ